MPHDRLCVVFRGPTSSAMKSYCNEILVKKPHWDSAGGSFAVKNVEDASVDEDGGGNDKTIALVDWQSLLISGMF